jgi:hypothetical protein
MSLWRNEHEEGNGNPGDDSSKYQCVSWLHHFRGKAVLKHQAAIAGSVKVFVSHADLPLGTPVPVIQNATNERVAQLNSGGTEIFVTQSWVPAPAPGFEAFATAAGIEKLHQEEYCFGRIN